MSLNVGSWKRRAAVGAAITLTAGLALLVGGAAQASETFPVRIVAADGFDPADGSLLLDLADGPTFADAQALLGGLADDADDEHPVLVPLGIPGLPDFDLPGTSITSDGDAEALVLTSEVSFNGATLEASLVLDWDGSGDTAPDTVVVLHGEGISLSTLTSAWPETSVLPALDQAWIMLTPSSHTLEGTVLSESVGTAVPDEDIALTGGVTFRAIVDSGDGPLGDVVRLAGLDPATIGLQGELGVDGSVLSGAAPTLRVGASLVHDPDAPAWLVDAAAELTFDLDAGGASLAIGGEYTVDLGGGERTFTADLSLDASSMSIAAELVLTHAGDLQLPEPLDWITLGDASLSVRYDDGVTATVHGEVAVGESSVTVDVAVVVSAGAVSLDVSVVGPVDAADVAALFGEPLGGFDATTLAGLDGISIDSLAFSIAHDAEGTRVSGTGAARLRDAEASILFSALKPATGPARLMAGLHLGGGEDVDFPTLGDLLGPGIGEVAAAIPVPTIDLVYLGGSATLGEADLDQNERAFFAGVYGDDLSSLSIRPGLSLATRIPLAALDPVILDLLGLDADDEALLEGYVGSAVGAVAGNAASDLTGLELHLDLPPSAGSSLLPEWLDLQSDWDLQLKAVSGAVALRATADVHATISTESWDATLLATFEQDDQGVRASLEATLGSWEDPFGLEWFDLDGITVKGSVDRNAAGDVTAAASVEAGFTITVGAADPKRFTVAVSVEASDTVRGTFTATLLDPISLGDVLTAIEAPMDGTMPAQLSGTSIGPVSISATVGGGLPPTLSVFAHGHVQLTDTYGAGADMLATITGTKFTLGIRPDPGLSLADIFPPEFGLPTQLDVDLPNVAIAVTNGAQSNIDDDKLTDEEQAFWAPIYGCDPDDLIRCEYKHTLPSGVSGIASMGLPDDVKESLSPFQLDFSQPAMVRGNFPIFGGSLNPSLLIKLPSARSDAISEFFEEASLYLKVDTRGLTIGGELAMRMPRYGEGPGQLQPCRNELVAIPIRQIDGTYENEDRCYDVLRFGMEGSLIWQPTISIALTGTFTADGDDGWMSPFGVGDWIGIKRLAAQISIIPSTRTFGIGFLADFRLLGKDLAGSINLGLSVIESPPYVMPELLGFRMSSSRGLSFGDVVDLQNEYAKVLAVVAGYPEPAKLDLAAAGFPDLALRNLDLMYARQSSPALCLETGLVIAADLYVNPTDSGDAPIYDGEGKCRVLPSQMQDQSMTPECVRQKANGCFASVMLSVTMDGILGSGNVAAFDLGPIHWRDSYVDLALTLAKQHLALKGGAALDGVFTGDLELAMGLQGFKLKGDVDLFNGAGGAYIEADGAIDLANLSPNLHILATMHADFEDRISAAIDVGVAPIRTTAVALDVLWDTLLDLSDPSKSSVDLLRQLPQKMRDAGLVVPAEVELVITTIADIEAQLKVFGSGAVVVDTVLNGLQLPDFPGWEIALIPTQPTCLGWTVNGGCWLIPPVYYGSYTWWNIFCWCDVFVPARWDYTFAIPAIVAQPTCLGDWDGSRCWAFGLRPFSFPALPGVCDLTPGLREFELGGKCTLRQVMERVVGPAVGQVISAATGQPAPANLSQFLDQIVGGLKAAGGLVKVECATFALDIGGGLANPSARTEIALAMNLFGTPLAFGAAWDFSNMGASIVDLPMKVIDQLIHPTPVSCQKLVSTIPPALELAGGDRVDEDGSQTVTGTFATAGDRSVTLEWGDGATETIATSGASFIATHRYVDDDPTGAPAESYVIRASYAEGETTVAGSKLLSVRNVAPSSLSIGVSPTVEGGIATLTGSFADIGGNDTHEVIVSWGDGSQPVTLALGRGTRTFNASHPFAASGSYPLLVSVVDDDTGRVARSATIAVTNAPPSNLVLALDDDDVDEGSIATVLGTFDDPGADDRHTVTVDWGDGSAPETLVPPPGGRDLALGHRFIDDTDGTIVVTVEDDEGATTTGMAAITVSNVAPSDAVIGTATDDGSTRSTVGESTEVPFSGSFADPGVADTHTVTVDWGAGSDPTVIHLPAGESSFTTTHHYEDDDPTATAADLHAIGVTVTDDDGGTGTGESEITIADSAASDLTLAPAVPRVDEGSTVTYLGSFLDAGLLDDHVVTIDWGDGTAPSVVSVGTDALAPFTPAGPDDRDPGLRTFSAGHTYADDGASGYPRHDYPVTVTVVDDDTVASTAGFVVPVHNVAPSALALDLAASTVDEHGAAELSGTFADPGRPDTHTVVVDWGDGSPSDTVELTGEHAFAASHRYLDDEPTATPSDGYRIAVFVTDDDTGAAASTIDIRVDDVAPSALTFSPVARLDEGSSIRWNGAFADPGGLDTHTVLVAWGDGRSDVVELSGGERTFGLDHTYVDDDPTGSPVDDHDVTVAVVDDDTLLASLTASHSIHDVAPSALTFSPVARLDEGLSIRWNGAFADPGGLDTHTVRVAWGDGSSDVLELSGGERTFGLDHTYVDDDPTGSPVDDHDVTVAVIDDDTLFASLTASHSIHDVAPSALALAVTPPAFDENGITTLTGSFADPGARDTFTVVVNWGEGTVDTLALPAGARSFAATHQYGDDGTFPIGVVVTDDDTKATSAGTSVTVANVAPTLAIDRTAAQWVAAAGGPTVTTRAGESRTLAARSTDPGSDDLTFTWTWGDGTTSVGTHRNGTGADPDPSPTVGPRDVTDVQTHAWANACLYAVPVATGDDDGGAAPGDSAWVIVTGTSGVRHGTGWWHSRYDGKGGNDLPAAVQSCYLRIASHASAVFGDSRPAGTNALATAILTGAGSDPRDKLDRTLLSVWLDYADGAFRWTDAVDTDGRPGAEAVFADVMRTAERVRLDPTSTKDALHAQRQRLERMVLPGQRPPVD